MKWLGNELTYCLNVHPGESLSSVLEAIKGPVRDVKRQICPEAPFGLGLRLSAAAVEELHLPEKVDNLRACLDELGMYTFTVNGFPYGTFHGEPVKDGVYQPDWTTQERRRYTTALARVMTKLAPAKISPSISTLPLGYRLHGDSDERRRACAEVLLGQVADLWLIQQETGVRIGLALEPEPHCILETVQDVVRFFEGYLYTDQALETLGRMCGVGRHAASDLVHAHLGVCLDTCHAAVEFEQPEALASVLAQANIKVMKVQVSCGLRIPVATDDACTELLRFDEPIYLHQVVANVAPRTLRRYADIRDALADPSARGHEWRVHFHVPVHESRLAVFESTQAFTADVLRQQRVAPFCEHWEVETYTWHVLPNKPSSLVDSICSELRWVQGQL